MQLKVTDLVSIGTQLLPKALSHAFGIQSEIDESPCFERGSREGRPRSSSHRSGSHQPRKASPSRKRQHQEDAAHDAAPADLPNSSNTNTAVAGGSISRQQPLPSLQQDPAMVQAAASMQAASAMAQAAAASMQTTSGMSAGYQRPHAVPASAAVMNSFRGFPAAVQVQPAAYRFSPQTLLPYMGAAVPVPPQAAAMAMSNLTGSLGCAPMSVYSGPADYGQMVRTQQEEDADDTQARALKRPRLVWTPALHKLFEEAVAKLGLDKAVPKTIMQIMNVEGLTRENVASHLQKYRLGLKKSTDGDGGKAAAEGAEGAEGAGSGEATGSGDKAGQQDAAGASSAAAAGGGGSGGSGSSAGGGGGSSSSGRADGSSSSKGTKGEAGADAAQGRSGKDAAAPPAAAAAAGGAGAGGGPAAAEGVDGAAAGDRNEASSGQAALQQQQQQSEEQVQQQGQQAQQQDSQLPAAAVDQ